MPVKNRSHSKSRSHRQRGGRVSMPSEYFGGNSGRYFAEGSPELADGSSAYGPFYSVSQGVASHDGQMFGPNVGPYPAASCTQTGGKKSTKKSPKQVKKPTKQVKKLCKKSKKTKKGSFWSRLFK